MTGLNMWFMLLMLYRNDAERAQVIDYVKNLEKEIRSQRYDHLPISVKIDDRDIRGGEKAWHYIKQGVPVRVEVGPRDMAKNEVFVGRRDKGVKDKSGISKNTFVETLPKILDEIQQNIFNKAKNFREENMKKIDSLKDFEAFFGGSSESQAGGFALVHWNEAAIGHEMLAKLKVTPRCIPLNAPAESGTCLFTGKESNRRIVFAKAY